MKYAPCNKCTSLGTPGFIFFEGKISPCECNTEAKRKEVNSYLINKTNIPSFCRSYNIYTYILKNTQEASKLERIKFIVNHIDEFIQSSSRLYIYGEDNTQKTSVASYMIKEASCRGIKSSYTTMPHLLSSLLCKEEYEHSEEKNKAKSLISKWLNSDLLCIDDCFDISKVYFSGKSNYKSILMLHFFEELLSRLNKGVIIVSKNSINKIPWSGKEDGFDKAFKGLLDKFHEIEFRDKLAIEDMKSSFIKNLR